MKKWFVATTGVLGLTALCANAWAAPLRLPEIQAKSRQTSEYKCAAGKVVKVTYLSTANGQSFVLVPVKGQPLLFVRTMSGSGETYKADNYTWSTKGPNADLSDEMGAQNAPPLLADCVTKK